MGRKKVAVQYIEKEKKRNITYEKRKKGLVKKAYELATLCDVPLCMVIYPDPNSGPNPDPVTYPEKKDDVTSVINRYVSGSREVNAKRNLNLQQGLALGKRKKKGEEGPPSTGTSKAKAEDVDTEDVTGFGNFDGMSKEELVKFGSALDEKLRKVEERMRGTFGIYNGNANAITSSDQGMQMEWPDQQLDVGPNYYNFAQLGPSAVAQPHPLTSYYNASIKFEPQGKWYEQGSFFI